MGQMERDRRLRPFRAEVSSFLSPLGELKKRRAVRSHAMVVQQV